ncbi:MAG: hypothetical protein M3Y50_10940 [Acidobacteriota bacterium]|nr:hypothetical protein [Acidobacteriota bacterium]
MNRSSVAQYSIGTVSRSYLIEHEIALGMKRLFFEGGTPHTIRHSFVPETAVDIDQTICDCVCGSAADRSASAEE